MIEKAPIFEFSNQINDVKLLDVLIALEIPEFNNIEENYPYWDKVKYIQKPNHYEINQKDFAKKLWIALKTKRHLKNINRRLSINTSIKYKYNINDFLQQKLHYLDFNFGAGIQKEQLLNDIDKHRYLTNALMEESIFSSMIEGATTTRIKAKEMLRKGNKPSNKSEQMILNNYKTIQYISEHKDAEISSAKLFEIHRLVTENTLEEENIGVFRNSNDVMVMNQITGEIIHTPSPFEELDELMKSFCDFFNTNPKENFIHPIVKASILHFLIGYIHPFVDGNGRTARALFYWYLLKNGYWLTEYLSISRVILKTKTQYEKAYIYSEIDEMDVSYFIHYQVKVLTQAFEDLKNYNAKKKKEENKLSKYLKLENINERQAQILYWIEEDNNRFFTVKEIETIFKITNQTARTDIEYLVEKRFLKKIKVNNKSFNYWKGEDFDNTFS
jgi:Fic family protein